MDKNEEIVDELEDKEVGDYIKEFYEIEKKIEYMLGKMKNNGVECDCDDSDDDFIINAGYDERRKDCLKKIYKENK